MAPDRSTAAETAAVDRPYEGAQEQFSIQEAEAVLRLLAQQPCGPAAGVDPAEGRTVRAELRYQALVERIPAITFMAALDQGINELYVSPQIERILGYTQQEWLQDPVLWYTRLHPDDRERWHLEFARTCATGAPFRAQYRFLARDGRVVWVHGEAELIRDEQGLPLFLQGVAFDITQQKEAEETLLSASRAKSEFLSRMSHELRTPLNAILGFSQLLGMSVLTAEQHECIGHVNRAGKHLLGLIDEVLDIARIEAGRMDISPEPIDAALAVQSAWDLMQPLAVRRGIRFRHEVPAAEPVYVLADQQKLNQVLLNLLSNAVKYNRDHGEVRVACVAGEEGRVRLAVCDTGPGIAPDKISRLFVPFDRLGAEQTGVEGAGLGLTLCKSLVEMMHGTLTASSTAGAGCCFTVELPRAQPPAAPPPRRTDSANGTRGGSRELTILYVEDNLDNLRLVQQILTHRPRIRLHTAMQGTLGLELARQRRFDLILLDVHLPDVNGGEVLRALKAAPETAAIPVIVLSADATPRRIEQLRSAGAAAYLTKPIDVARFLSTVDDALATHEAHP